MTVLLPVSKLGTPGLVKDTAEYVIMPQAFTEVQNVRFGASGAKTFWGDKLAMTQAPITPLWLKVFPPLGDPIWVYGNETKMYAFDTTHHEITRVSGNYAGNVGERWQGEVLNELGFFNNAVDIPQAWPALDATIKLIDLPNWPATLRCKALRPHGNFLFALHTIEAGTARPFRVRWSDAAEPGTVPASWALNDPTFLSGEFDIADTSDYVVDGKTLGATFIVYKQKSAHSLRFIYPNNDVWGRTQLFDKGVLWRDCVQEFPGGHAVFGLDDIYIHSGAINSAQSVVEGTLREWVFQQIGAENYFNCYTAKWSKNEIAFCFPEAGEIYPNLALVWNWVTGGMGVRDLAGSPFIYPGPVLSNPEDEIWDPP